MNKLIRGWRFLSRPLINNRCSFYGTLQLQQLQPSQNDVRPTEDYTNRGEAVSRQILEADDYFGVKKMFTVQELMAARVHYGHRLGSLDVRMKRYLFGARMGHCIIDLDKTADNLAAALNFVAHVAYRDGVFLFVVQQPHLVHAVEEIAKSCGEFAHTRKWRSGMLTNADMMFGSMTRLPDCCLVMNCLTTVLEQHPVVVESAKMGIPTVGVVDTNCNPNLITYPVPANDDSPQSVVLLATLFANAVLAGKRARKAADQPPL